MTQIVTFIVTEKFSLEGTELLGIVTLTPGNSVTLHVKSQARGESLGNVKDLRRHMTANDESFVTVSAPAKGNIQSGTSCSL